MPATYVINSIVCATLASVAYNARSLDRLLADLAREHHQLRKYSRRLDRRLIVAAKQVAITLEHPRDRVEHRRALRALARINEERAALSIGVGAPDSARPGRRRRSGRSQKAVVPVVMQPLDQLCRAEAGRYERQLEGINVVYDIEPGLAVRGHARIALVAATTSAAIGNALRHAPKMTALRIEGHQRDDSLVMRVENDGATRETAVAGLRSGLQVLRDAVGRIHGRLEAGPGGDDVFRLDLVLPPRSQEDQANQLLAWEHVEAKIDRLIARSVAVTAGMVAAGVVTELRGSRLGTAVSGGLSLLVPAAEWWATRSRQGRPAEWPLVLAALVSAANTDPHRGILCGWANAAVVRHALAHHRPARSLRLLGLNAAGIAWAYRRADRTLLAGQLMTLAAAPLAVMWFVAPGIRSLRDYDRDVVGALSASETVNAIAMRLISDHSSLDAISLLCADMADDDPRKPALLEAAGSVRGAASRRGLRRVLTGLLADVHAVVGRRVWPATISVTAALPLDEGDGMEREAVAGLNTTQTRRATIAAADLVAREAVGRRPVRPDGSRPLSHIDVLAEPRGDGIALTFWPIRRAAKNQERLRERLHDAGASLAEWTADGRLSILVYAAA
jgi:hypothetical protein